MDQMVNKILLARNLKCVLRTKIIYPNNYIIKICNHVIFFLIQIIIIYTIYKMILLHELNFFMVNNTLI